MFTMNVPKFLWGEDVKTAAYIINRMPSRVLGYKTPMGCLNGTNDFIVPPKVFGCTCFVHDCRVPLESLIHVPSNAYLWGIHQVRRGIVVGAPLNGDSL
jgi:hypothetical protein